MHNCCSIRTVACQNTYGNTKSKNRMLQPVQFIKIEVIGGFILLMLKNVLMLDSDSSSFSDEVTPVYMSKRWVSYPCTVCTTAAS